MSAWLSLFDYAWQAKYAEDAASKAGQRGFCRDVLMRSKEFQQAMRECDSDTSFHDFVADTMLDLVEQRVWLDERLPDSSPLGLRWPLVSWTALQQAKYGGLDVYSRLLGGVAACENKVALRRALRAAGIPRHLRTLLTHLFLALNDARGLRS